MGRASRKKKKGKKKDKPGTYEDMVILNTAGDSMEMAYPRNWSFEPDPRGYFRVEDAEENAVLEFSTLHIPPGPLPPDFPGAADQLRESLLHEHANREPRDKVFVYHQKPEDVVIREKSHFGLDMAWYDHTYDAPDRGRDSQPRLAHGRHLIATNLKVQTLWTYYYWDEYREYGVYWWKRMVATLHIGEWGKPTGLLEHSMIKAN